MFRREKERKGRYVKIIPRFIGTNSSTSTNYNMNMHTGTYATNESVPVLAGVKIGGRDSSAMTSLFHITDYFLPNLSSSQLARFS